jgi:peptidoglycan/xylan/chitin deacetylase (PgdA/CDA1 family)
VIIKRIFPILSYHRVLPKPLYGIDISCEQFEEQMAWFSSEGYRAMPLGEFYDLWSQKKPFPDKSLVITIDDGHKEVVTYAYPLLKKYGLCATLFVNTGLLGKRYWVRWDVPRKTAVWSESKPDDFDQNKGFIDHAYEFMSWDEVRMLSKNGIEIGSHGVEHPYLTKLSDVELQRQLVDSKRDLIERLGHSPEFFCCPSGDYDTRVLHAVRTAGYKAAVQTPSPFDLKDQWSDPFVWNRIGIAEYIPLWKFKGLVSGWYLTAYHLLPSWLWNLLCSLFRQAGGGTRTS